MAMAAKEDMILIVNKEIKTYVIAFLYDQKISGENVSTLSFISLLTSATRSIFKRGG